MVIEPENKIGLVTKKLVLFGAYKSLSDVLIGGGNGSKSGINSLLGTKLIELMDVKKKGETSNNTET
ncbi:MAG: hypothetical protein QM541_02680 [Flavobacterium sp.]|nr:hypothetical protein [Flavobacterium sp.]